MENQDAITVETADTNQQRASPSSSQISPSTAKDTEDEEIAAAFANDAFDEIIEDVNDDFMDDVMDGDSAPIDEIKGQVNQSRRLPYWLWILIAKS